MLSKSLLIHIKFIKQLLRGETQYVAFDPLLGWSIKKNGMAHQYCANSLGIRATREYGAQPAPGKLRIATFGDSFTHGSEVANDETWQD